MRLEYLVYNTSRCRYPHRGSCTIVQCSHGQCIVFISFSCAACVYKRAAGHVSFEHAPNSVGAAGLLHPCQDKWDRHLLCLLSLCLIIANCCTGLRPSLVSSTQGPTGDFAPARREGRPGIRRLAYPRSVVPMACSHCFAPLATCRQSPPRHLCTSIHAPRRSRSQHMTNLVDTRPSPKKKRWSLTGPTRRGTGCSASPMFLARRRPELSPRRRCGSTALVFAWGNPERPGVQVWVPWAGLTDTDTDCRQLAVLIALLVKREVDWIVVLLFVCLL